MEGNYKLTSGHFTIVFGWVCLRLLSQVKMKVKVEVFFTHPELHPQSSQGIACLQKFTLINGWLVTASILSKLSLQTFPCISTQV